MSQDIVLTKSNLFDYRQYIFSNFSFSRNNSIHFKSRFFSTLAQSKNIVFKIILYCLSLVWEHDLVLFVRFGPNLAT